MGNGNKDDLTKLVLLWWTHAPLAVFHCAGRENLSKLGKGSEKERYIRAQGMRSDQKTLFYEVSEPEGKKKSLSFVSSRFIFFLCDGNMAFLIRLMTFLWLYQSVACSIREQLRR